MAGSLIGWIWNQRELTSTQQHILLALNERIAWNDFTHRWECHPSYNYIAKMTGRHRSTVMRAVNSMVGLGILTVEASHDHIGRQRNNFFIFNAPPLVVDMFEDRTKSARLDPPEPVGVAECNGGVASCDPSPEKPDSMPLEAPKHVGVAERPPPVAGCDPQPACALESQNDQILIETAEPSDSGGSTMLRGRVAPCDPIPLVSKFTSTTGPGSFSMRASWQPCQEFDERLGLFGIPPGVFTQDLLGEFISYWLTRLDEEHTQAKWEHKLAGAIKRAAVKLETIKNNQANFPGGNHANHSGSDRQAHKSAIVDAIAGAGW